MTLLFEKGYVASFLAHGAGKAVFVGLYAVKGSHPLTLEQYWEIPEFQRMKKYGVQGFTASDARRVPHISILRCGHRPKDDRT